MIWNATKHDGNLGYVSKHGRPVLDPPEPSAGESIPDLGCGTGTPTAEIARPRPSCAARAPTRR